MRRPSTTTTPPLAFARHALPGGGCRSRLSGRFHTERERQNDPQRCGFAAVRRGALPSRRRQSRRGTPILVSCVPSANVSNDPPTLRILPQWWLHRQISTGDQSVGSSRSPRHVRAGANVKTILNAADFAAVRTALALTIGTNVQAWDANLDTWAGITPGTGVGTAHPINVGTAGAFVTNMVVRWELNLRCWNQLQTRNYARNATKWRRSNGRDDRRRYPYTSGFLLDGSAGVAGTTPWHSSTSRPEPV